MRVCLRVCVLCAVFSCSVHRKKHILSILCSVCIFCVFFFSSPSRMQDRLYSRVSEKQNKTKKERAKRAHTITSRWSTSGYMLSDKNNSTSKVSVKSTHDTIPYFEKIKFTMADCKIFKAEASFHSHIRQRFATISRIVRSDYCGEQISILSKCGTWISIFFSSPCHLKHIKQSVHHSAFGGLFSAS